MLSTLPLNSTLLATKIISFCNVNAPLKVCDCAEVIFAFAKVVPSTEIAPFCEVTSLMFAFLPNVIFPLAEIVPEAVAFPESEIAPLWEVALVIDDVPPTEMLPFVVILSFAVIFPFTKREFITSVEPADFSKVTFVAFALFPIAKS